MDITEIQRIIRDCYEWLYANNMDNLEEMDEVLEGYSLPKLNRKKQKIWKANHKHWNWNCDYKTPNKQKCRTRWFHRQVPWNI